MSIFFVYPSSGVLTCMGTTSRRTGPRPDTVDTTVDGSVPTHTWTTPHVGREILGASPHTIATGGCPIQVMCEGELMGACVRAACDRASVSVTYLTRRPRP